MQSNDSLKALNPTVYSDGNGFSITSWWPFPIGPRENMPSCNLCVHTHFQHCMLIGGGGGINWRLATDSGLRPVCVGKKFQPCPSSDKKAPTTGMTDWVKTHRCLPELFLTCCSGFCICFKLNRAAVQIVSRKGNKWWHPLFHLYILTFSKNITFSKFCMHKIQFVISISDLVFSSNVLNTSNVFI